MTCEMHAKQREAMRKRRLDSTYREREKQRARDVWGEMSRARRRDWYANLDGYAYNKLLLRHRRTKALARMAKRHVPKEKEA